MSSTTIEEKPEEKKPDPKMFIGIYQEESPRERTQNVFCVRTTDREDAEKRYADFISTKRQSTLLVNTCVEGGPLLEIPLAFHKAVETVLMSALGVPPLGYQEEIDDPEPLFVMVFAKKDGGFHAMPLVNNGNMEIGMGAFVRDHMPETGGEALTALATVLDRHHCSIGWRQR